MKTYIPLLLAWLFLAVGPSYASDVRPAGAEDIERAENYLQNLKSAQARFVQTAHDGTQFVGTFYLKRPGKLRFEYDPPLENFVVADGLFIYFYDAELQEQTNAPIKATLANFFLRKNFSLSDDLIVKDAKFAASLLQIEVAQADEPNGGKIIFAFQSEPFALKKWRVIDAQGLITEVELFHLKNDVEHEKGLFVFVDPNKKNAKPSYND